MTTHLPTFRARALAIRASWLVEIASASLLLCLGLGGSAAAEAVGDPGAGRDVFKKCAACHRIEPGRNLIGPSLFGVIGRRAGSIPGFSYSPAMKSSGLQWTDSELNRWLTNPKALVPGTKMVFPGLKDPTERANVIAYLKEVAK